MRYFNFSVISFYFHTHFFDFGSILRMTPNQQKKPIRCKILCWIFQWNKYLKTIIIPEACRPWKLMVHFGPGQFEKFEQICGTVNTNGTTTLKFKKRFENSICFVFHLSTYLLLYVPYMQNFKMHSCGSCWWCKIGIK